MGGQWLMPKFLTMGEASAGGVIDLVGCFYLEVGQIAPILQAFNSEAISNTGLPSDCLFPNPKNFFCPSFSWFLAVCPPSFFCGIGFDPGDAQALPVSFRCSPFGSELCCTNGKCHEQKKYIFIL